MRSMAILGFVYISRVLVVDDLLKIADQAFAPWRYEQRNVAIGVFQLGVDHQNPFRYMRIGLIDLQRQLISKDISENGLNDAEIGTRYSLPAESRYVSIDPHARWMIAKFLQERGACHVGGYSLQHDLLQYPQFIQPALRNDRAHWVDIEVKG